MSAKSPPKLVKLRGNPRHIKPQPAVVIDMPDEMLPPKRLTSTAKKIWLELGPVLHKAGMITAGDMQMFAVYCETYARWDRAQHYLRRNLDTAIDEASLEQIDLRIKIIDKAQAQLIALAQAFGITPRSRNHITPAKREAKSAFGDIRSAIGKPNAKVA